VTDIIESFEFTASDAPRGWREIDPSLLEEDIRPVLPAAPLELLPKGWRDWISEAASNASTAPDYVLQALLAAIAGLAGSGVRASVKASWSEPLVLWQALVGAASTGKSPALNAVRRPLAAVEKLLGRGDGAGAARPEQGKGAVIVREPTLAALGRAVEARPPGVLLWCDDATPWLQALVREARNTREGSRWIDAWSGLDNLAISIVGSLHPERLATQLQGGADGLPERFLYTWPSVPLGQVPADDKPGRDAEAAAMLQRISAIVGAPDRPLMIAFDDEARKYLDRIVSNAWVDMRVADPIEAAWVGKGRGTIVRLAGIMALLDWSQLPENTPPRTLHCQQVEAASRLWRNYFRPHAGAVLERATPSNFDAETRRVVRWLKARGRTEVTRTEVRVQALGKSVNASRAQMLLRSLHSGGIVRPALRALPPQGGRPPQVWEINPALMSA
jgi:uncharacterized protein DUF3987